MGDKRHNQPSRNTDEHPKIPLRVRPRHDRDAEQGIDLINRKVGQTSTSARCREELLLESFTPNENARATASSSMSAAESIVIAEALSHALMVAGEDPQTETNVTERQPEGDESGGDDTRSRTPPGEDEREAQSN
eukprot:CAMPEP_0198333936 /NCGR_PEP_ID=MMETSP1450-20131203/19282_1 /TAXON_ID=753684 ORGANISM="Madagascaria erythrocladiodes, Strain CCMP3234" /NCGR_SAMPLE_ID=MMETSP1450 /ASSEMBLY_ACC=CAM_ASM_001115 /LENGTH=134 /DNA_ID=CAMNT_0044038487 /DNA_START=359 /DNA_END=763 /DNA_ORIENTATION=+